MKKTIWKFKLKDTGVQQIYTQAQVIEVLCVKVQYDHPCIWCVVDQDGPPTTLKILQIGTGHSFEDHEATHQIQGPYTYIGSYLLFNGSFVGHVFVIEEGDSNHDEIETEIDLA